MSPLGRLRLRRSGRQYSAAWDEWFAEDHELWEAALADGLDTED